MGTWIDIRLTDRCKIFWLERRFKSRVMLDTCLKLSLIWIAVSFTEVFET